MCRIKRAEVQRVLAQLQAVRDSIADGLHSGPSDGLPRPSGVRDAVSDTVARLDDLERQYADQINALTKSEKKARAALDRIMPTPRAYSFFVRYYVYADKFGDACKGAGISPRQGQRYKKMIG